MSLLNSHLLLLFFIFLVSAGALTLPKVRANFSTGSLEKVAKKAAEESFAAKNEEHFSNM